MFHENSLTTITNYSPHNLKNSNISSEYKTRKSSAFSLHVLTLCAVSKPLGCFGVSLKSSSPHVGMIEVILRSIPITSIIATWREDDLRPTPKHPSCLLTTHSVNVGVRSCCLPRRSLKILALWENHSLWMKYRSDSDTRLSMKQCCSTQGGLFLFYE